jgi:maleylpyruvate isomerase
VSTTFDATWINRCVEGCAQSHQLLLNVADAISDDDCRGQSLLEGWTRGHVLTHLARNAERHIHLFECAGRGEIGDQYPGGMSQRNADIEDGATRSVADIVADLRRQVWGLEAQWAHATPDTWQGSARRPGGQVVPVSDLVFLRWREVAIHIVDLNVGVGHESWSDFYVQHELERQQHACQTHGVPIDPAVDQLEPAQRLAWMIGRVQLPQLGAAPGFQV